MDFILDILGDALRTTVLVTGLVVIMMMLIELVNINSRGRFFQALKRSRTGQVVLSTFLGVIPGCMGGFASVSLYTHGIISFGALVAMMIASSGDEAFVMLAMFPGKSLWIFAALFAVAIAAGVLTDFLFKNVTPPSCCTGLSVHEEENVRSRSFGWRRAVMFAGVIAFIAALLAGCLEHDGHEAVCGEETCAVETDAGEGGLSPLVMNILSEEWMYWMFAAFSLAVLVVLVVGSDHFVNEHLWHHIVSRHLPSVFLWTFGVLTVLGVVLHFFDIGAWVNGNTAHLVLLIFMAALIGIIPESGPHLAFVTLYASGIVPLPVLLASCISQDGHASLPLFAESRLTFIKAKAINLAVAIAVGCAAIPFFTSCSPSSDSELSADCAAQGLVCNVRSISVKSIPSSGYGHYGCCGMDYEADFDRNGFVTAFRAFGRDGSLLSESEWKYSPDYNERTQTVFAPTLASSKSVSGAASSNAAKGKGGKFRRGKASRSVPTEVNVRKYDGNFLKSSLILSAESDTISIQNFENDGIGYVRRTIPGFVSELEHDRLGRITRIHPWKASEGYRWDAAAGEGCIECRYDRRGNLIEIHTPASGSGTGTDSGRGICTKAEYDRNGLIIKAEGGFSTLWSADPVICTSGSTLKAMELANSTNCGNLYAGPHGLCLEYRYVFDDKGNWTSRFTLEGADTVQTVRREIRY